MKQLVSNYTISTANKTITLPDFTNLTKERLLLITDTTTQATVYQFNTTTAVTVSGNVITFGGTFTPAATDTLQIYYDTKQGDPHFDDWQLLADVASNNVVQSGSITAADTASSVTTGQGSQSIISGTATTGSVTVLTIPVVNGTAESFSNVVIDTSTSTFGGTYTLERSANNGSTWTAFNCFIAGTPDQTNTATLPGVFHGNAAGITNIRVRATAYTSGTLVVRIQLGIGTGTITVGNPIRIYDGVNKTQASIKAASTVPLATDSALVTVESPNSPLVTNTTGLATASAQTAGNNSLTTITTNTNRIPAQGAATTAASLPVNIANDQTVPVSNASLTTIATNTGRIPVQGAAVTANSTPVNIASDQTVNTRGVSLEITNSITAVNGDVIPSTDVSMYKWLSIQITGTFNATVSWQASNDNATWVSVTSLSPLSTIGPGVSTTGTGIFTFPIQYRYFRARVTTYTSGTVTGISEFYTYASSYPFQYGSSTQNGTWSIGLNAGSNIAGGYFPVPSTSSSTMLNFFAATQSNTVTQVKGSSGRIHKLVIYNPNTSIVWLQIFNAVPANVTLGTTTPLQSYPILASGVFEDFFEFGDAHNTAISIAVTTTVTGATAPTNGIVVNLGYI